MSFGDGLLECNLELLPVIAVCRQQRHAEKFAAIRAALPGSLWTHLLDSSFQ